MSVIVSANMISDMDAFTAGEKKTNTLASLPTNGNDHVVGVGNADSDMRMHQGSLELFDFTVQLHKASLLDVLHVGLIDQECAGRIAGAISTVVETHDRPADAESLDYLDFESRMTQVIGSEASLLHLGRSRQDLLSTYNRQTLRVRTLAVMNWLNITRHKILQKAEEHAETVIPMYTHGVPAQPTTFGHYLLAYAEAFGGIYERLCQSYSRVNLCPFGAAVGSTSKFPLDRHYLATLLAFDGVIENAYGANHVASVDAIQDTVSPLTILALHVGAVAQDMTAIQSSSHPWLSCAVPGYVGVSSIMPQKRNPRILEYLREIASEVFAGNHMAGIMAHNCTSGLTDARETFDKLPLRQAVEMLQMFGDLLDAVRLDGEKALDECTRDYSTVTELADTLFSRYNVPFRTGHHFASIFVDFGRVRRIGPLEISYDQARQLFAEVSESDFPLTKEELFKCLSPTHVVQSRMGLGGPQRREMSRMLREHKIKLEHDDSSLKQLVENLADAEARLNRKFDSLLLEPHMNGHVS